MNLNFQPHPSHGFGFFHKSVPLCVCSKKLSLFASSNTFPRSKKNETIVFADEINELNFIEFW